MTSPVIRRDSITTRRDNNRMPHLNYHCTTAVIFHAHHHNVGSAHRHQHQMGRPPSGQHQSPIIIGYYYYFSLTTPNVIVIPSSSPLAISEFHRSPAQQHQQMNRSSNHRNNNNQRITNHHHSLSPDQVTGGRIGDHQHTISFIVNHLSENEVQTAGECQGIINNNVVVQ